jgi:hypothetical protein
VVETDGDSLFGWRRTPRANPTHTGQVLGTKKVQFASG